MEKNIKPIANARCGTYNQKWYSKECAICSEQQPDLDHLFRCFHIKGSMEEIFAHDGRGLIDLLRLWKRMNGA